MNYKASPFVLFFLFIFRERVNNRMIERERERERERGKEREREKKRDRDDSFKNREKVSEKFKKNSIAPFYRGGPQMFFG